MSDVKKLSASQWLWRLVQQVDSLADKLNEQAERQENILEMQAKLFEVMIGQHEQFRTEQLLHKELERNGDKWRKESKKKGGVKSVEERLRTLHQKSTTK